MVKEDLAALGVTVDNWFKMAQNRKIARGALEYQQQQKQACRQHQENREVECGACGRTFRREADKTRHECVRERMLLVFHHDQLLESVQCLQLLQMVLQERRVGSTQDAPLGTRPLCYLLKISLLETDQSRKAG